jgi:hypothetical protein
MEGFEARKWAGRSSPSSSTSLSSSSTFAFVNEVANGVVGEK